MAEHKRGGKDIGFKRNIRRAWLDEAAALVACGAEHDALRGRLDEVVGAEIASPDNKRKAIDILVNIWEKTRSTAPGLWAEAVERFPVATAGDRLRLHYGLALVAYPFFRDAVAAIGQLTRFGDAIRSDDVRRRLFEDRGQPGSMAKAVERVVFSLRDWGLLTSAEGTRFAYLPVDPRPAAADKATDRWLLACALAAHPADEVPLDDLARVPELFPFDVTLSADELRRDPRFTVQRLGGGWDAVRLTADQAA